MAAVKAGAEKGIPFSNPAPHVRGLGYSELRKDMAGERLNPLQPGAGGYGEGRG